MYLWRVSQRDRYFRYICIFLLVLKSTEKYEQILSIKDLKEDETSYLVETKLELLIW